MLLKIQPDNEWNAVSRIYSQQYIYSFIKEADLSAQIKRHFKKMHDSLLVRMWTKHQGCGWDSFHTLAIPEVQCWSRSQQVQHPTSRRWNAGDQARASEALKLRGLFTFLPCLFDVLLVCPFTTFRRLRSLRNTSWKSISPFDTWQRETLISALIPRAAGVGLLPLLLPND